MEPMLLAAPTPQIAMDRIEATPDARGWCPQCQSPMQAKCGPIVTWHWAHKSADCDPWSEPEGQWHLTWKRFLRDRYGARLEVIRGSHRADAVLPDGRVVELQSRYLSAPDIAAREAHWGRGLWVYRCTWEERLHWGQHGFWWKHGAKSQVRSRWPVWWDMGDRVDRVSLGMSSTRRILGVVLTSRTDSHPNMGLNMGFNSGLNTDGRTDELTNGRSFRTPFPPPSSNHLTLSNAREKGHR